MKLDDTLEVVGLQAQAQLKVQGASQFIGPIQAEDVVASTPMPVEGSAHFNADVVLAHSALDPLAIVGEGEQADKLRVQQDGRWHSIRKPASTFACARQLDQAAFKVTTEGEMPLAMHVDKQGFVGIHNDAPEFALDVGGPSRFSELVRVDHDLVVDKNILVTQNLEVYGQARLHDALEVTQASVLQGPVQIENTLSVKEALQAQASVQVDGELHVSAPTHLHDGLQVQSGAIDQPALITTGDAHFIKPSALKKTALLELMLRSKAC